jgi:hypothetical protein
MKIKKLFLWGLLPLLITGCFSPKKVTKSKPTKPTFEVKKEEYVIKSNLWHTAKVEMEYSVRYIDGGIEGCKASYILTNIGDEEIFTVLNLKKADFKKYNFNKIEKPLSSVSAVQIVFPKIIFVIETSDGKKIEHSEDIDYPIKKGISTEIRKFRVNVSNDNNRYCTKIYPDRIEYMVNWY